MHVFSGEQFAVRNKADIARVGTHLIIFSLVYTSLAGFVVIGIQ